VNGTERLSAVLALGDVVRLGRTEYVGAEAASAPATQTPVESHTIVRRVAMGASLNVDLPRYVQVAVHSRRDPRAR
jgi:hypothetical protein